MLAPVLYKEVLYMTTNNKNPSAVAGILAQGQALAEQERPIGESWPVGSIRRITADHFGLPDQMTRRLQQQPTAHCERKKQQSTTGHTMQQ
jgi:hypothetical protein